MPLRNPEAGALNLYPQEITRALLNLISNGFYAATWRKAEARDERRASRCGGKPPPWQTDEFVITIPRDNTALREKNEGLLMADADFLQRLHLCPAARGTAVRFARPELVRV